MTALESRLIQAAWMIPSALCAPGCGTGVGSRPAAPNPRHHATPSAWPSPAPGSRSPSVGAGWGRPNPVHDTAPHLSLLEGEVRGRTEGA